MQIITEAPFTIKESANETIQEKLNSLEKFRVPITRAEVYFKVNSGDESDIVVAEVQLHVPGPVIFASSESSQFLEAFSSAVTKVKSQLLKMKDKMADHHN